MSYEDIIAYRVPFQPQLGEGSALLPPSANVQEDVTRRRVSSPGFMWAARGFSLLGLGGGIALKTFNFTHFGSNRTIHTLADLVSGISLAALSRSALPERVHQGIFNEIKRWCVPAFEISTNIYLNLTPTTLVKQLYFCSTNVLNALTAFDDVALLALMKERYEEVGHLGDKPLPMLEGDAKSFKRLCLNQGIILTTGVALITLGMLSNCARRANIFDTGVAACSYALGSAIAQRVWARAESLERQYVNRQKPYELRLLNVLIKFFQMAYPIAFSMSIVSMSNKPVCNSLLELFKGSVGYGLAAMAWGAGNQITRTNFQYKVRVQEPPATQTSLWGKIKGIWNNRKGSIIGTAVFGGILSGWFGFGEYAAGIARIREGVGALFGSTIAGYLLNSGIDLLWRASSDSAVQNSLFYNTVALSPAAFSYLFLQTKLVANDVFLDSASGLGFSLGIGALILLGLAIGQNRWSETREGRTEPALTSALGRALMSYETGLNYPPNG